METTSNSSTCQGSSNAAILFVTLISRATNSIIADGIVMQITLIQLIERVAVDTSELVVSKVEGCQTGKLFQNRPLEVLDSIAS